MENALMEVAEAIEAEVFDISDDQRQALSDRLAAWLTNESGASVVDTRFQPMLVSLQNLAKSVYVEVTDAACVVKAPERSSETLLLLRRGSTWFNPIPECDNEIVAALLSRS